MRANTDLRLAPGEILYLYVYFPFLVRAENAKKIGLEQSFC